MKFIRKFLGIDFFTDKMTTANNKLQNDLNILQSKLDQYLKSKSSSENDHYELIKKLQSEFQNFSLEQGKNVNSINTNLKELSTSLYESEPPNNFEISDPIVKDKLFIFQVNETIENDERKKLIDENPIQLLNAIGNIPHLASTYLLGNSYSFQFPEGIAGRVMEIGAGQGTAITSNAGKIVGHGNYISNFMQAAPLLAYSAANTLISQHYLAKINKSIDQIDKSLKILIQFEFIKKESKIESIIKFYRDSFNDFNIIIRNKNYRQAILTAVVQKNIEVQELIQFYKKAIPTIDKTNSSDLQASFNYFIALQEIFAFGKILEFKFANEFNRNMAERLKSSFKTMQDEFESYFDSNINEIERIKNTIDFNWYDKTWGIKRVIGKHNYKEAQLQKLSDSNDKVLTLKNNNQKLMEHNIELLDSFLRETESPKKFLLTDGKLYEIE